ncbi:MAG: LolA-related protein [Rhodoferax sp.]
MTLTPWLTRPYSLVFAGLLAAAFAMPSHAADWDIDQLMHGLAQTRSAQARFVEKKTIAILDQPVESSGELLYTAPDRLEKRTIKPKPESMVVEGDKLEIERGRQKIKLQLQEYPELAAFIDSIRGTLAGDRKALERNYQLSLEGSAQAWTLKLVPVGSKMKQVVALIRMTGVRDEIRSIDVTQVDGDSSLMSIEKVASK